MEVKRIKDMHELVKLHARRTTRLKTHDELPGHSGALRKPLLSKARLLTSHSHDLTHLTGYGYRLHQAPPMSNKYETLRIVLNKRQEMHDTFTCITTPDPTARHR